MCEKNYPENGVNRYCTAATVVAILLVFHISTESANARAKKRDCIPPCRRGFVCVEGKCLSDCNPPCPTGTHCTGTECVPFDQQSPAGGEGEEERINEAPDEETTAAPTESPNFSLGLNASMTVLVGLIGAAMDLQLIVIPIEFQLRLSDSIYLSFFFSYAYQGLPEGVSSGGYFEGETDDEIYWIGAESGHQVFFSAGPRWTFSGNGLDGWYLLAQVGFGYTISSGAQERFSLGGGMEELPGEGSSTLLTLGLRPEIGYSWSWVDPGFFLAVGVGARLMFPILEDPEWLEEDRIRDFFDSFPGYEYSQSEEGEILEALIFYMPMLTVTLGFSL